MTTKAPYVTITRGIRGYFAVVISWNAEAEIWEPEQSGHGSYATAEAAIPEAKEWAKCEEIAFKFGDQS